MRPLQHALRQARLHPGFAATVIGTTALTIGAATAIFSLFDAAFLRPFPYPAADRLVQREFRILVVERHRPHRGLHERGGQVAVVVRPG